MKLRTILAECALCLASVSFASAKTHDIILSEPALAGTVQLPAGEYSLKVEGENAVFTNLDKDKTFTAPVSQQTGEEKYDRTAVRTDASSGTAKIVEIDLGGSHTKLEFAR
jgi:hypothetical protein